MKKALIVTTVSGFVPQFEMNNVRILQDMGYEVHYATNYNNPSYGTDNSRLDGTGIIQHQIDFVRSPFAISENRKVYNQLKKLMTEIRFDLVHCHTPMGAAMARIVAKKTNTKPVIYTVHGLHFYKGAPIMNWLIYYPVEKLLSRFTDVLITINQEDYHRAQGFHAKRVKYIPGVGIDSNKAEALIVDKASKKKELGLNEDTKIIITVGELIKRKNYETAITAFAKANLSNTVLLICGHGVEEDKLRTLVRQLGVVDKVIFLGYRVDVCEIMKCSDLFFFPSYQEGLSVALMEAMSVGLPIICSRIRGNVDLIKHSQGGYLYAPTDVVGFTTALKNIMCNPELQHKFSKNNLKNIKRYDIKNVDKMMKKIYRSTKG